MAPVSETTARVRCAWSAKPSAAARSPSVSVQLGERADGALRAVLGAEALRGGSVRLAEAAAQGLRTEAVPFRPGLEAEARLAGEGLGEGVGPVVELDLGRSHLLEEQRGRGLEVPPGKAHEGIERVEPAGGEVRAARERQVEDDGAAATELVPVSLEWTMEDDLAGLEPVAPAVSGLHEVAGEHHCGVGADVSVAGQAGPAGVVAQDGHSPRSTPERGEDFQAGRLSSSGVRREVSDTS